MGSSAASGICDAGDAGDADAVRLDCLLLFFFEGEAPLGGEWIGDGDSGAGSSSEGQKQAYHLPEPFAAMPIRVM